MRAIEMNTSTSAHLPSCDISVKSFIGPEETFQVLGWWSISMFIILLLHLLPVLLYTALSWRGRSQGISYLLTVPSLLLLLTSLGILLPTSGKYVETALEIVISLGMVRYIKYVVDLAGGTEKFSKFCVDQDISINLGSPPFICLLPLRKPSATKLNLSLIKWGPITLLCMKIIILSVDVIYLIVGYSPSGFYLDVDNIHAVLNIPAGLLGIYCYNMYLGPIREEVKVDKVFFIGDYLGESSRKHAGTILLMEYVLFDVLRLFYVFLTGTGILTCLPPYYSVETLSHLLKNIMKAFLATWIGFPYIKSFTENQKSIKSNLNGVDNSAFN